MDPANDEDFQKHLRQFLENSQHQEAFYQQAAAYFGARRLVQDLEELDRQRVPFWRRVRLSNLIRQSRRIFQRSPQSPRRKAPIPPPDYIDAEIVSDSDEYPSVIVIPPHEQE